MKPSSKSRIRPKPSEATHEWQFEAIGTQWWIGVFEPVGVEKLKTLQRLVAKRIEEFDKTYSRFRDDSLVARIAEQAGEYRLPPDSKKLFELYRQLYDATDGVVTPLIGDMLVAAGYDASYSFLPKPLSAPADWDEALVYANNQLTIKRPITFDFGAAGKGYLVDLVAEVLRAQGITGLCVDAGGDMVVYGNSLKVGLEHPNDPEQVIGSVTLHNRAIAGSSPNRRKWAGYHHIMNPHTLQPAAGLKAVWVVAKSALLADGLATALFFVPPERLKQFDFEYLLVNDTNQYKQSPDFPAELF